MTSDALWNRLAGAGLVHGPMPALMPPGTPWYVSAMVGVAAWIASFFLLACLGAALGETLRTAKSALVVGTIVCALCAVAMRTLRNRLFAEQFAIAASLAGQALVAYGILDAHWRSPAHWFTFAVVEVALVAAAPPYLHRVLCTIAAIYATRFALAHAGVSVLFPALVAGAFVLAWWFANRGPRNDSLWLPVTAGLALAALLVVPVSLADLFVWQVRATPIGGAAMPWLMTLALTGLLLAATAGILRDTVTDMRSRSAVIAFAAAAAIALAAHRLPGLVVALIVLLVAFAEGRRALVGFAIAGLIGALVHHYYALDATLLAKSMSLFATGVVLVIAGIALRMGLVDGAPRA